MQRNNTPILIGTILFGLLALGATVLLLFRPSGPPPGEPTPGAPTPTPQPKYQWVARRDIPPRIEVKLADLEQRPVPAGQVPGDAVANIDQIEGLLTKAIIYKGKPITLSQFQPKLGRVIDANIEVPTNYRAVAIWVDPDQTAAGLVDVGDHVDVLANHTLTWDKGPDQYVMGATTFAVNRTIAQNLVVLAVDKSIKAPPPTPTPAPATGPVPPGPPAAPTPAPPPPPPNNGPVRTRVILAAPPAIASQLIGASQFGTLHIIIRNPDDDNVTPIPAKREFPSALVTLRKPQPVTAPPPPPIPSGVNIPMPKPVPVPPLPNLTPMPPADKEITVIRGTEKTRVIVPNQE